MAGRFTSPDEPFAGQSPGKPQSWNLYSYGLNNPLLITDPTGREPCVNNINPLNGNICADVVVKESSPPNVKAKQTAQQNAGAGKEVVNWLFIVLNYSPAGLAYLAISGHPALQPLQPSNTDQYQGMKEVRLGSQFMLFGELTLPEEIEPAAAAIANGHAFGKHAGEFSGMTSEQQFQSLVQDVIANAKGSDVKNLSNGRSAYWDNAKGVVVIHDPSRPDQGTAFVPTLGRAYFDGLTK